MGHFPTLENPETYPRVVDFLLGNPVGEAIVPAVPHTVQEGLAWVGERVKSLFQ